MTSRTVTLQHREVWVLDTVCYGPSGGTAELFATKEAALASVSHITEWTEDDDGELCEVVVPGDECMQVLARKKVC